MTTTSTRAAVAPTHAGPGAFDHLVDQWAVQLTTYKRDDTPVHTLVNIAVDGDRAWVRTFERAWKVRRIRRDPRVMVAPSTWRGRVTGPAIAATARILEGEESERAGRAIDGKHRLFQGLLVRLAHRLFRYRTVHIELTAH